MDTNNNTDTKQVLREEWSGLVVAVQKDRGRNHEERSQSVSAATPTEMWDTRSKMRGMMGEGKNTTVWTAVWVWKEMSAGWCKRGWGSRRRQGMVCRTGKKETKGYKGQGMMFRGSMQSTVAADCLAPGRNDSWLRYCFCLFARYRCAAQRMPLTIMHSLLRRQIIRS